MFLHIWMHWFWITAAHFKGFLLFTVHSASFQPCFAGAVLLDNETHVPLTSHHHNDSSQTSAPPHSRRITSPAAIPADTTPPVSSSSACGPREDAVTTSSPLPPGSDAPDSGGAIDGYGAQFSLKKATKYSKYGKVRAKGKEDKGDKDSDEDTSTDAITAVPAIKNGSSAHNMGNHSGTPAEDAAAAQTLVIENKVEEGAGYTTVESFSAKNKVAAATSAHNYEVEEADLNAGSITGITLGVLVVFSLFGVVSFILYRRRYLNKPEVLHDKCSNLDSSGYIDETSLRENSEEMYSLDNDSFLNSLEAMTIQNYWTESVKHTKL